MCAALPTPRYVQTERNAFFFRAAIHLRERPDSTQGARETLISTPWTEGGAGAGGASIGGGGDGELGGGDGELGGGLGERGVPIQDSYTHVSGGGTGFWSPDLFGGAM